jgi:CPA1 family monovalent cation:H+ antiporter
MESALQNTSIHAIEIVFLTLLLFVIAFGTLARKLEIPYPIILVIGGLLLSFIPGTPRISFDPDVVFFVVLPPLLYYAAWATSWREFSYNLVSISLLAFGLVTFTVIGIALLAPLFLPGFDWRMGVVLGAVIAPTDTIAATSIAKRLGLPKRIVDVLEGESLINDATGLLALEFGIAMLVSGHTPTLGGGLWRLIYLTVSGIAVGLVIGVLVDLIEHHLDDGPIEITLSIMVPYAVYLAADAIHASGVLAVVACGLFLSRMSSHFFSPTVRLQAWAFWDSLYFILNGLVFVLLGLQLPYVLQGIRGLSLHELILYGGLFSAVVIVLRLLWTYPGARFAYLIRIHLLHQPEQQPPLKGMFIVGWAGMRGVIALAAAIALPQTLANGAPFSQRNMIAFLAFSVILVTLVLQGLTLPPLIRWLGLAGVASADTEEEDARRVILQAALKYLEESEKNDQPEYIEIYKDLAQHYRNRLATLAGAETLGDVASPAQYRRHIELSRELLRVERQTAVRLRNQGRINDESLRKLEHELDLSEANYLAKGH